MLEIPYPPPEMHIPITLLVIQIPASFPYESSSRTLEVRIQGLQIGIRKPTSSH